MSSSPTPAGGAAGVVCPKAAPRAGSACGVPGSACRYSTAAGCEHFAVCDAQHCFAAQAGWEHWWDTLIGYSTASVADSDCNYVTLGDLCRA